MNPNYTEFKFPQIKAHPWTKVSLYELHSKDMWADSIKFQEFSLFSGFGGFHSRQDAFKVGPGNLL